MLPTMSAFGVAYVDRFQALLKTETDPTKRLMIIRLLAEENMKEPPQLQAKRANFAGAYSNCRPLGGLRCQTPRQTKPGFF